MVATKNRTALISNRSGILETQLQAVNAIIDLAINDPFINLIFTHHMNSGKLVWDIGNYDSELLLTSCRKALVSLSPSVTALHGVARQYDLRASNAGMTLGFLRDSFVPVMSHYLQ